MIATRAIAKGHTMNQPPRPSDYPTFSINTTSSAIPARAPEPPRRRRLFILPIALAVALAGIGGGLVGAATHSDAASVIIEQARSETAIPARPVISSTSIDAESVGIAVIPSIVTVEVGSGTGDAFRKAGSGSGVVLDHAGHIVTNNHVVQAGTSMRVVLSDGRVYEADLVGTDPVTDLAVVHVPTTDLDPITFGSTNGLEVGSPVVAVGSPLGLEGGPSLSVGVISCLLYTSPSPRDGLLSRMPSSA